MKKVARLMVVGMCLAATVLLAAGCATGSSNDRTVVDVPSGRLSYTSDVLSVVLDENVTTGYAWTCQVDGPAVEPTGDEPLTAEDLGKQDDGNLAGASAAHLFEFAPGGSGEATVTLRYERSWENVDPVKTVVIRAAVEDGAFIQVEAEEQQAERSA